MAVFVGHHDGNQCSTEVGDGHFIAGFILQDEKICLFSIDSGLEIFTFQATDIFCFSCVIHKNKFLVIIRFCKVNKLKR